MSTCTDHNNANLTIEDYLRGQVAYPITDEAITAILFDRGHSFGEDIIDFEVKDRELSVADALMWCASQPSITGSVEDANGVWKHKEGARTISASDKAELRRRAYRIYRKYGLYIGESSIKMHSIGLKINRTCR